MRILVVDDTTSVRNVTERMLSAYEVTCAASGVEAIEIVQRQQVDLVLMDVVMDRMSGTQAARIIRAMRPFLPIVFMTGFPEQLEALHGEIVLEKPFTAERLVGRVERMIKKSATAPYFTARLSARRTWSTP